MIEKQVQCASANIQVTLNEKIISHVLRLSLNI